MKIGDMTIKHGMLYNRYYVLVEMKKNYNRKVEFRSFENAQIFSAITKLGDAVHALSEPGVEE